METFGYDDFSPSPMCDQLTSRVARRLSRRLRRRRDVTLTDEELYQRTRRIVIAEMQNVVYGQWLRSVAS